jgi:hypothetical protein
MNYVTTIPLPQEYNQGLVPLNLFAPSTIISITEFILGTLIGSVITGSIFIGVTGLPIYHYGGLFFITSSMALSHILCRHVGIIYILTMKEI